MMFESVCLALGYIALVCGFLFVAGVFGTLAAIWVNKAYQKWQWTYWGIENCQTYKKEKFEFYRWRQSKEEGGEE